MANYSNDRYADPYQQHQNQYATYDQHPQNTYPNPHSGETPQYSSHNPHDDYGYENEQQPHHTQEPVYYPSTDKINENSATNEDYSGPVLERERKGRQNIGGGGEGGKSWANGPPPRSTGILRMWRKDERGKQWTRVSHSRTVSRGKAHVAGRRNEDLHQDDMLLSNAGRNHRTEYHSNNRPCKTLICCPMMKR
jgi:hypothetical protein